MNELDEKTVIVTEEKKVRVRSEKQKQNDLKLRDKLKEYHRIKREFKEDPGYIVDDETVQSPRKGRGRPKKVFLQAEAYKQAIQKHNEDKTYLMCKL